MPGKVWEEITYPFINFNGCTVEVEEWISYFTPIIWHYGEVYDAVSVLVTVYSNENIE